MKSFVSSLRSVAAALCVAAILLPAHAVEPEKPMPWIVDWDDHQCRLLRLAEGNPRGLEIRSMTAEAGILLTIGNDDWKTDPRKGTKTVDILLLPQARRISLPSQLSPSEKGQRLIIQDLDTTFLEQLAASDGLAVEAAGERLIEFRYPSAAAAVRQLGICNKSLLSEWGVDVAILDRLQHRAVPLVHPWKVFSFNDYPFESVRRKSGGTVVALYTISTEGRVEDCVAARSSGDKLLDNRTCRVLERRLRYRPAIGPDGQPIAVKTAIPVKWSAG